MKKVVIVLITNSFSLLVQAQYSLRIMVDKVATKGADDIYVAGSFNNWNPKSEAHKLKPFGTTRRGLVLKDIPAGQYEFKFTRGSWPTVEVTGDGREIPNRIEQVNGDVVQTCQVAGWKDNFPDKPIPNTATPQVSVMDTAFAMPQLNRTRRISIYLPKGYATSAKKYPVLYMNDGQNLFNLQTAPYGEWGVDESLDSLQPLLKKECIVVGIDHGNNYRMTEYNPYDNAKYGKGEGKQYLNFIIETLKPYIDKQYRTSRGPAYTYIAGSSMGGLISTYAIITRPDVFGGAGIFSPSYWIAPQIFDDAQKAVIKKPFTHQFYFYAGGQEGGLVVPDLRKMETIIEAKGAYHLQSLVMPLGKHNEATWQKIFPQFYRFITQ